MARKDINFNDGETFNIRLEGGDLTFLANGQNGDGDRRMVIRDLNNQVDFDGDVQRWTTMILTVERSPHRGRRVTVGGSGAGRGGAAQGRQRIERPLPRFNSGRGQQS